MGAAGQPHRRREVLLMTGHLGALEVVSEMESNRERTLYARKVLGAVGDEYLSKTEAPLTGFLAMRGSHYRTGGIMVVGRAVNGWTDGIHLNDLRDAKKAEAYAKKVQRSVEAGMSCQMRWVSDRWGASRGYCTKRSAFWRCIRGVVHKLAATNPKSEQWASHLVWSNLYKLSPEKGGNPSEALCEAQFPGCKELLDLEIKTYRPGRLLFLTGWNWAKDFLPGEAGAGSSKPGLVAWDGKVHHQHWGGLCCVVAVHPQGRDESCWIDEVVNTFIELSKANSPRTTGRRPKQGDTG